MPTRLKTKARIKRASRVARENANRLDEVALGDLQEIYSRAVNDVKARLEQAADAGGIVRIERLGSLKAQLDSVLSELDRVQRTALFERMDQVTSMGIEPVAEMLGAERVARMTSEAVRAIRNFTAADGLQLSDRLWRVDQHAREVVTRSIESAVVQGHSASQAAQDFLNRGVSVPDDIARKIGGANAASIGRVFGQQIMTGAGSPYDNARRIFRTEINRAHVEAYRSSVFEVDDVVGTRFLLSPNHPEQDICDMHARVNRYGLGPGVYPKGKSPLPAHPNTLSYEEVVFADEVSDADRAGREGRVEWIAKQPANVQQAVLGGRRKRDAFLQGHVNEGAIATPWKALRGKLERRGVDVSVPALPKAKAPDAIPPTIPEDSKNPYLSRNRVEPFKSKPEAENYLRDNYGDEVEFNGATQAALNSIALGLDTVLGAYGTKVRSLGWTGNKYRRALGVYVHPLYETSYGRDQLRLKRKYVLSDYKKSPENHLAYLNSKGRALEAMDERISRAPSPIMKERMRQARQYKEAATRWSASSVAQDPVFTTTAHEAGHALYYQADLPNRWRRSLQKHGVEKIDWYRVSEYAGTNESELFAEVTAFFANGMENTIPKNVAEAYLATVKDLKVIK